jgi:hypothetical protein
MGIRLNARGRKRIPGTPIILNFGARSGVSWSLKLGRLTYSPKARRLSINTPGIGSVQVTPGRKAPAQAARGNTPARRYPPADLVAYAQARLTCRSCGSEPGDVCRTATKRTPTDTHRWRLEDAWDGIAGDRDTGPSSPATSSGLAAATVRRLLGLLAVAALLVLVAPHVSVLPW